MFQKDQFEKVSSAPCCPCVKKSAVSKGWQARNQIGNTFAFLILALLMLGGVSPAAAESAKPTLDLNQATSAQLEDLPGIGAVKAAAILAVRDAQGGFKSMEDLESVRGIGPALVTKLRPLVRVGESGSASASTPKAPKAPKAPKSRGSVSNVGSKPKAGTASKTAGGGSGRSTP